MNTPPVVRIVMAEDNNAYVLLFREALRTSPVNFELERYTDGEACIRSLAARSAPPPDLIVIDLNMPRVDGFEILKTVRGDLRFAGVPVAVVTSSSSESERPKSVNLGANAFIEKPSRLRDFLTTVGTSVKALLCQ
jgi:chemotaxis family two-component system response regulator Rcp1